MKPSVSCMLLVDFVFFETIRIQGVTNRVRITLAKFVNFLYQQFSLTVLLFLMIRKQVRNVDHKCQT